METIKRFAAIVKKHQWMTVLVLSFFVCVVFSLPYWIEGKPFSIGGDHFTQWYPFYLEFRNLISDFIHEFELPFYSWNIFLGNNAINREETKIV